MISEIKFSTDFERAFKRLKNATARFHTRFQSPNGLFGGGSPTRLELHDHMRKVRIAFTSKGKGERAGGRVIIRLTVSDTCLSFLYIYDKSDLSSISDEFLDSIILSLEQ